MSSASPRSVRKTKSTAAARPAVKPAKPAEPLFTGALLERIWEIHGRLCRGERFDAITLAREFEVDPITIKRTIGTMRTRLGMSITWSRAAGSYLCKNERETLPLLRLDAQEALALALAGRLFDRGRASPFGRILDGMLKKIAPVFGSAVSVAVESVEQALSRPGLDDEQGLEYFFPLLEAIIEQKELRIDYVKKDATTAETRTAHPLHLAELDHRWKLLAYDTDRGDIRQFALARIESFTTTGATFERPKKFNAREYLAGCLSAFAGTEEHEVRFALDAHAAFYAREKPWHASQRLKDLPDGRVELTLRISHLNDAKNTAIHWGDHVEVLAPPALREDVHATLARAIAKYAPVER